MQLDKRAFICICVAVAILVIAVIGLSVGLILQTTETTDSQADTSFSEKHDARKLQDPSISPWHNVRLTENVIPLHYDLQLHPDLVNGKFSGHVTISVHVNKATDHFIVHQHELSITDVRVKDNRNQVVGLKDNFPYPKNEFYVLRFGNVVAGGQNYSIYLEFQGRLLEKIVGFYRSSYKDSSTNETRYLATSKFQPTYARQAFPCFDEPSFKSTFTIQLVHEDTYFALSNMDVETTKPYTKNLVVTKFRKSVPMVTYLACFIVCDFKYKETLTGDGKKFRVYTRPDQVQFTDLVLSFGSQVQDNYAKYFDIPFPLPKQDNIAIPDFPSGAMEHWGLITYRETVLIHDAHTPLAIKQRGCQTVAHELTHQWFGNLVTMKWWDDLWLNEGFASFFAYKGVSAVKPDWITDADIIVTSMQKSFGLDNKESSHPIVQPVNHPDEITEIFDTISYSKGASILRMLEGFMGADKFQLGIQKFLKAHQYGHAETNDLWNTMSQVITDSSINVAQVMKTWTLQMGFPVVSIHRNGKTFTATQKRYLLGKPSETAKFSSSYNYLWEIPLSYISQGQNQSNVQWMHMKSEIQFEVPVADDHWVKFNAHTTGYYRVNYDIEEWQKINKILVDKHQEMDITDRTGLIDDSFALAYGGYLAYDIPLNMTFYLVNEMEFDPWTTASAKIQQLAMLLFHTSEYANLRTYFTNVVKPHYHRLGWNDTGTHLERKLRRTILHLACTLEYEDCLKVALANLLQWLDEPQKISSDLIDMVLRFGIKSAPSEVWDKVWQKYLVETSARQQLNLLLGLASAKDRQLLRRLLEYSVDEKYVRRQNYHVVIAYVASTSVGQLEAWNFITSHWEKLVTQYTLNDRYLGFLIPTATSGFTTHNQLTEMQNFFAKHPQAGAGTRARLRALDNVKANIGWLESYRCVVGNWLDQI